MTVFEEHPPFTNAPGAAEFIALYHERAAKAGIPDTTVEVQAAASYTAWQILEAGVRGANSLDDAKMAAWLKAQPRRHDPGQAALRRSEQLRRRPDARQAGAERPLGHRLPEGVRGSRRDAARAMTLPSATLLAQSALSGVFIGSLYGLLGLGLGLSWGLLHVINLAHFGFAFLAAYLCYQLASVGGDRSTADARADRPAVLRAGHRRAVAARRASRCRRSTRCSPRSA